MRRIVVLAVITGALMVPATAGANNGIGGIGAGGVPACAAAYSPPQPQQKFASVNALGAVPGVPGPRGGPNSMFGPGVNNGIALIVLCQSL